jgi:hypothetical protein
MDTDDEFWENPAEIADELHRTMHYANDLIKRAAHAGLSVDLIALTMHGARGEIPQMSIAVTKTLQRE